MTKPTSLFRLANYTFAIIISFALAFTATARPVPQNLANGLEEIVSSYLITTADPSKAVFGGKFATQAAAAFDARAIIDMATGRYLVDIMPNGSVPLGTLRSNLTTRFASLRIKNVDQTYMGHGVLEGYVAVGDVAALAQTSGVGSVILQLHPVHNVGLVTSQGVNQH